MDLKRKVLLGAALTGMISGTAAANQAASGMGPQGGNVECYGVNACKGKGECGSKDHGCAGMNECKGKGWISLSKKACEERGGTYKGMSEKK